jgi:hypothetical protein
MPPKSEKFDLYTFVAGAALEADKPFALQCNCRGVVTQVKEPPGPVVTLYYAKLSKSPPNRKGDLASPYLIDQSDSQ